MNVEKIQRIYRENGIWCTAIPTYQYDIKPSWFYYIMDLKKGVAIFSQYNSPFPTYEKALKAGLKKLQHD